MNKEYEKALQKGIAITKAENGEAFMKAYKEMTADFCNRQKQKVIIKGFFPERR
jgi:hypothetical protein